MDLFTIQLVGIMGGTVAGLLAALAKGGAETRRATRLVRKIATGPFRAGKNPRLGSPGSLRSIRARRRTKNLRTIVLPSHEVVSQRVVIVGSKNTPFAATSACPSCGLEAPHVLMAEHFAGSPSHKMGIVPEEAKKVIPEVMPIELVRNDDTRSAVRNLIQMLVPPRAFGRRNAQKTENPLAKIVQEIVSVRKSPVSSATPEAEPLTVVQEAAVVDRALQTYVS